MEEPDVIIIGSGIFGIAAARTFLETHPDANLIVLESEAVIGGTWSVDRVYDEFWTQTPLGMAEFSDAALYLPSEVQTYYGFFPAKYITKYLEDYVDAHIYGGKTIRDRVLLNHEVKSVEKAAGKWKVSFVGSDQILVAAKLVIASGLTSKPHEPMLPNKEAYKGDILHHKMLGRSLFLANPEITSVAVLGGGKSAADTAYACAKAGKSVSWIIREGGCGPAAHGRPQGRGPYESSISMFNTRMSSSFSPSIFSPRSLWSWLLHGTHLGMQIVDWIWASADLQNRLAAGYHTRKGAGNGFQKLEPETPIFWQNDSTGINQRPDFWEVIAAKVSVYRSDITDFFEKSIKLSNGTAVAAEILICATGWNSSLTYLTTSESARLGLPIPLKDADPENVEIWKILEEAARREVLVRYPRLANPPDHFELSVSTTPYRLYKGIAPLDDQTVVILGHINVGNAFMAAECQAIWAMAYLDGQLTLPPRAEMAQEIAMTNEWCKLRYLSKGQLGIWYYFDLVPYVDMLLAHIKLSSHKKTWASNIFSPLIAKNLRSLIREYMENCGTVNGS